MSDVDAMNQQLLEGAKEGDLELMREALQNGADVNAQDVARGATPLHCACLYQWVEGVRFLSTVPGIDFNAVNQDGESALFYACLFNGNLEIARLLLENGTQVNTRENYGDSPLHDVVARRNMLLVQEFIQHGADLLAKDDDGDTPFDLAIAVEGNEIADYILTVAYKDQVFEQEANHSIHAILDIAEYRYLEEEDELEEDNEESVQQQQKTLQVKLPVGKLTIEQFQNLLQSFDGNLMRQRDNTGALPFHVACRAAAPVEILDLLLQEHPRALHVADNNNSLPIHCACQANAPSLAVLQFLSERAPAAVRARDNTGSPPLHRLSESKPLEETVAFLLKAYDGSISLRRNNGDLPLMVAYKTRASLGVCLALLRAYPDALEDL